MSNHEDIISIIRESREQAQERAQEREKAREAAPQKRKKIVKWLKRNSCAFPFEYRDLSRDASQKDVEYVRRVLRPLALQLSRLGISVCLEVMLADNAMSNYKSDPVVHAYITCNDRHKARVQDLLNKRGPKHKIQPEEPVRYTLDRYRKDTILLDDNHSCELFWGRRPEKEG